MINEKPQIIQEYESGKAIPNQQLISKLERVLGVKLRGKKWYTAEPLQEPFLGLKSGIRRFRVSRVAPVCFLCSFMLMHVWGSLVPRVVVCPT